MTAYFFDKADRNSLKTFCKQVYHRIGVTDEHEINLICHRPVESLRKANYYIDITETSYIVIEKAY